MHSGTKPDSSMGSSGAKSSLLGSNEKKSVFMDLKTTFLRAQERLNAIKKSQEEQRDSRVLDNQVEQWKVQSTLIFPAEKAVLSQQILR